MLKLPAFKLSDDPKPHIGQPVTFPDYHGRPVAGTFEDADCRGPYTVIQIDGRGLAIHSDTEVEIGTAAPEAGTIALAPDSDRHPCCRMLLIQPHDSACTGEVRRTRRARVGA